MTGSEGENPASRLSPEDEEAVQKLLAGEERLWELDDDALEQRIEELQERAKAPEIPGFDAEFESKVRELEVRANAAKNKREEEQRVIRKQKASDAEAAQGLGNGLAVAYAIIGVPMLGFGIGWLVDRQAGGSFFGSLGAVLGMVIGMAYAMFILNRRPNP
jgi:F0F1-type ATP synthase assembly protein I